MKSDTINSYTYKNKGQEILYDYFFTKDMPIENRLIWLCIRPQVIQEGAAFQVSQPETILNQPVEIIELIVKRVLNNHHATNFLVGLQNEKPSL